jgi:putative protein-disulfide isomerase
MCAWCWGFRPVWQTIRQNLPKHVVVQNVLGGLAPDSDEPMPIEMQQYIQANWRRIEQTIPGTSFNDDFWRLCQPRRSTYPACRAVLSAKKQGEEFEEKMIESIQRAYYLNAQNPSDDDVLIALADSLGLQVDTFRKDLNSEFIYQALTDNLVRYSDLASKTGASGFPSLVLQVNELFYAVPRDYLNAQTTLDYIQQRIEL